MIGKDRRSDIDGYGIWPWIGGLFLCGLLVLAFFLLSNPIS